MGDNAYRLELPDEYGVSPVFNVTDLEPFVEPLDSRMNLSQPRKNGAIVANEAQVLAKYWCDQFDDFDLGPFNSYSGVFLEGCDSIWTCFKVHKHEGIKTD